MIKQQKYPSGVKYEIILRSKYLIYNFNLYRTHIRLLILRGNPFHSTLSIVYICIYLVYEL